jgi:hypothetical protein
MVISFLVDGFMTQSVARLRSIIWQEDKMDDELEKIWEQSWPN